MFFRLSLRDDEFGLHEWSVGKRVSFTMDRREGHACAYRVQNEVMHFFAKS